MTGQDVRDLRRRIGLSQQGLAVLLGVTTTTVHRWETGKSPIPPLLERALETVKAPAK
jgi:DNA-binding transcriptional regulator YiaG